MKKVLLFTTICLVLLSSIVFCACDKKYDKLKIESNVSEIDLVLDDNELKYQNIIFELSGAKSWGKVSIESRPAGLIRIVDSRAEGKLYGVKIEAMQPTGDGASLVFTHLGSGKNCTIPLNIGRRLQTVASAGNDFIIQMPTLTSEEKVKIEIPSKELLNCYPSNYTDDIVWQMTTNAAVSGVSVVSYDEKNEPVIPYKSGRSEAKKTEVIIDENIKNNTQFTICPIAVLKDGRATCYVDTLINVKIMNVPSLESILVTSQTHYSDATSKLLKEMVLVSNPDKIKRDSTDEYNYYNTGLIELGVPDMPLGSSFADMYSELFDVEMSCDVNDMLLETLEFGKYRVIASVTSYGNGQIKFAFTPKNAIGDIEAFDVVVPISVGERATSITATNNDVPIDIKVIPDTVNNKDRFESINVPLNDSNLDGQEFKFNVLSTQTLSELRKYTITIDKKLLYINPNYIKTDGTVKISKFIKNAAGGDYEIQDIEPYEYQIAIVKDGKEITFRADADKFVSEAISIENSVYIKWVHVNGGKAEQDQPFEITINSKYSGAYNIENPQFDKLAIEYKMAFNRQRTVANVEYVPVNVVLNASGGDVNSGTGYATDWKFHFTPNMITDNSGGANFYGIKITKLKGLNNSQLIGDEATVDLDIKIIGPDTGLGISVCGSQIGEHKFERECKLNYKANVEVTANIIIFGVIGNKSINYGNWELQISQVGREIASTGIEVYKILEEDDISISIPDADYNGELLKYERITTKPVDFEYNYSNYYEYIAGRYVKVTDSTWKMDRMYYRYNSDIDAIIDINNAYILSASIGDVQKYNVDVDINNSEFITINSKQANAEFVSYKLLKTEPDDFATTPSNYYKWDNGYVNLSGVETFEEKKYYQKINTLTNSLNGFITTTDSIDEITTGSFGTFNAVTQEKNYIKITYNITPTAFDYYKAIGPGTTRSKSIYVYVYEPVSKVMFDHTMLEKYDRVYKTENNEKELPEQLIKEYCAETLNIKINGSSASSVINYVDIMWAQASELSGINTMVEHSKTSATYTFETIYNRVTGREDNASGTIYAVITQFGAQYTIQCGYNVKPPVLTDRLILNTPSQTFKSGGAYINMKINETKTIDVTQYSQHGDVTMPGVQYITCNMRGDQSNETISIEDGVLKANKAGRAKLVIVSTDALIDRLTPSTKYLNLTTYVRNTKLDCVKVVDIIVSDGSEENPYLIATATDFENITKDFVDGVNDKHYALTQNIDLKGKGITIDGNFAGSFTSYNEDENSNNRFIVYGVMLNKSNPTLFTNLIAGANIENITFYVDIDYNANGNTSDTLIGLIGTNYGTINNVTVMVSGKIYNTAKSATTPSADYIVGGLVAHNQGTIKYDDIKLIGIQGDISVDLSNSVMIGGLAGKNEGQIIGAHIDLNQNRPNQDVKYEVYYGNQGATVDIILNIKANNEDSCVGGAIGYNKGKLNNVYSIGTVESTTNNVGGLIGINNKVDDAEIKSKFTILSDATLLGVGKVEFTSNASDFQINNCYSTATIVGCDNVGGVVGFDEGGSYYKVYYEIYSNNKVSITGNEQVGGLIGSATDSNLYYCYIQNFAWDYSNNVDTFDIKANNTVGGLIGYAISDLANYPNNNTENSPVKLNVVSCSASVNIQVTKPSASVNIQVTKPEEPIAGGLIGKLKKYGAIYTAYFYGLIKDENNVSVVSAKDKVIHTLEDNNNTPYNNVYVVINNAEQKDYYEDADGTQKWVGFGEDQAYNNGKRYIVTQDGSNLVTIMPSSIEIDTAFTNKVYKPYVYGEYAEDKDGNIVKYDATNPDIADAVRYTVLAELVDAESSTDKSNYRKQAVVMYYYNFADTSGEYAIEDMYDLNTISIREIVGDAGIITVPPEAEKTFTLKSSDASVVRIFNNEYLLLRGEGQTVITITSSINPSVSASFVVIVRTKVVDFNLYTSADLHDDNKITANTNISIIKGSSKFIETNFGYNIKTGYGRNYECVSATNMEVDFAIEYDGTATINDADIYNYIRLTGTPNPNKTIYTIPAGESVTISVYEYVANGKFVITATPYIVYTYTYTDSEGVQHAVKNRITLPTGFEKTFNVVTKKGASAINVDRTQIDMMPSDQPSNLGVKISTDVKVDELKYEIVDITSASGAAGTNHIDGLDIIFNDTVYTATANGIINSIPNNTFDDDNKIQSLDLKLRLNENAYYITETYTLQVRFYILNGTKLIEEIMHINVLPQTITSVVPLNYRMEDRELQPGESSISFDRAYESGVIRPGSTNIITIDIVPNIAIYDYVEVRDITGQDKILFMQVDSNLNTLEYMDSWIDNGIKLKKLNNPLTNKVDSRLYLIAKLPENSTHNITHTIQIAVYTALGEPVIEYLNLEAIMYPTVVMKYSDPTGKEIAKADTRLGANQINSDNADLAIGVEAPINVETYNIDEGSLQHSIKIIDASGNELNGNYVRLNYVNDKYVLYFEQASLLNDNLIGGQIEVSFTASKHLNGIIETCRASINFTIRKFVIHSVSMTPSTIQNGEEKLYGDWSIHGNGNEIEDAEYWAYKEFCFDSTDISFYNNGYWNVKYTMSNTQNLPDINKILKDINSLDSDKEIVLYLNDGTKDIDITSNVKSNAGYVGDEFVIKQESENGVNKLKVKAYEGSDINSLKLGVEFGYKYQGGVPVIPNDANEAEVTISSKFGFIFTDKSTPFDEYLTISTTEEFVNMIEGKYYQLINDLVFEDEYTPLNTAISALNGNGYTITIKNFNTPQLVQNYIGGGMYIGLFGTLEENTIIQNLQVHYDNVQISLNDNETIQQNYSNEIFFGGIAAINLGAITNVNVTGSFKLFNSIVPSAQIDLGGIAARNGSAQYTKIATITNSTSAMDLEAIALIAGVAGVNYGKITNTTYTGNIKSTSGNSAFASTVFTAGFVVENMVGSYISLSYVNNKNAGELINSVGNTAGFVYNNAGTINNSYIVNASIRSQGNIGGFVYQNSGMLNCCYSYVNIPSSLFYQEFIYETSNVGEIYNCYTITDSTRVITILGLESIKIANKTDKEKYKNFVLLDNINGIWSMGADFPYLENAGFKAIEDHNYTNIYNIYDVETYQGYFKMFTSKIMDGNTFKIIRDIDFTNAEFGNPITASMALTANLEGNDMAILNYNIYKEGLTDNIGLFASIEGDVYVRNLILQPESIKATSACAVGALAGVIDCADVFNITIDNDKLLILGKNAVGGLAGLIKGSFTIAGITSNVSAFATYKHNQLSMYTLYTGKNVEGTESDNIDKVSYVGGIAGIINGYNPTSSFNAESRNTQTYYKASHLKVDGSLVLIAETVGALFGLVGEQTLVYYAEYQLPIDTKYQADFVAGGLVGENRGALTNCHISSQNNSATNTFVDTSSCFNYNARVNGGIVGLNIGGLVSQCTSNITISNKQQVVTVGGIIGRNIDGFVWDCTIDGILSGFYVGGIIGTDYSYNTMINVKNGYGVATNPIVYRNVNNLVSYNGEEIALKGNTLTRKFIQNFLNACKGYYEFNSQYVENQSVPLVNAEKAFGLIIGLTDDTYNNIEGITSTNYSKITISNEAGSGTAEYKLIYTVDQTTKTYEVQGYGNIIDAAFNLKGLYTSGSTPAVIAFLIAKEGVAYEGWSATTGYGDKIVIISNKAIQSLTFKSANILQYEDNKYAIIVEGKLIAVNKLRYTTVDGAMVLSTDESGILDFGYYTLDSENTPIVTLVEENKTLYVID